MARYGQAFKDRVVARLLPPEGVSVQEVSREIGVGVSTQELWRAAGTRAPAEPEETGAGAQQNRESQRRASRRWSVGSGAWKGAVRPPPWISVLSWWRGRQNQRGLPEEGSSYS